MIFWESKVIKFELIQDAEEIMGPNSRFSFSTSFKKTSRSSIWFVCSPLGTQEVTITNMDKMLKNFFICNTSLLK